MKKFIGALVAIAFIVVMWQAGQRDSTPSQSVPMAGTVATLKTQCPAMPTEEGWKSVSTSMGMGDNAGAAVMLVDHGGAFLPAKTTLMVKRWIFPGYVEVSVQGGPHMGRQLFMSWSCASER